MEKACIKKIRTNIKKPLASAGFKSEGKRYIRVVNRQICQAFEFQGFSSGDCFTINLCIFGLCEREIYQGNVKFLPLHMRIGFLLGVGDTWWDYSDESAEKVTGVILNELLPIFDRVNTYEALLHEVEEQLVDIPNEKRNPCEMSTYLFMNKLWGNMSAVCMAVGDYDRALFCVDNHMKHIEAAHRTRVEDLQNNIEQAGEFSPYKKDFEHYLEEENNLFEKELSHYSSVRSKLVNREYDELSRMLNAIEEKNLSCFTKYII